MPKTPLLLFAVWLVTAFFMIGCDSVSDSTARRAPRRSQGRHKADSRRSTPKPAVDVFESEKAPSPQHADAAPDDEGPDNAGPDRPQRRTLAEVFGGSNDSAGRWMDGVPRLRIDERKVAAARIRKLPGKHVTLYTDLPPGEEIDCLPEVFDQAFAQWCEYLHVDPAKNAQWKLTGFLMKNKERFWQVGLLPPTLPPFKNGFARNYEFWLYDQPSDYYRRHLMLHEGTHGFMNTILGGCGPPWYMEGIAELLSTHRWDSGRLTLGHMPSSRDEAPHWGRIRIVKDAIARRRPMRLADVIDYSVSAHIETEPYAWCWAAASLLNGHPRYQERFRSLSKNVLAPDFNKRFREMMADDWQQLCEEWQLLVTGLEYGHDTAAMVIDFTPGNPMPADGADVTVAAKGGWQNSGVKLEAGVSYQMRATGRYQVADRPQIWWSEPSGVSIRYYQGRPLGILLGALRPEKPVENSTSGLLRPAVVGPGMKLTPKQSGTLYFRINDSAAELDDNAGEVSVAIRRL